MLSVTSTLLAAARSGSATPYLRLSVSDRDAGVVRLRFARWYEGDEPSGPAGAACPGDGSLVRARIDPADGTLSVQRVEAPSAESSFDARSALATVDADAGLGLDAAGTRVLLATYEDGDVTVRESTDGGATFGPPSTVASVSDVTAVTCATDASGNALVAYAVAGEVWTSTRSGGGGWSTPAAWGHADALAAVNALAARRLPDWALLVSGEDAEGRAGAWTTSMGAGVVQPSGAWSHLVPVILAAPGTDVTYRASGIFYAGTPGLLLVESYAGEGAFDQPTMAMGVSAGFFTDGAWRDPLPLGLPAASGVAGATHLNEVYLASADGVWRASSATPSTQVGSMVTALRYESDARPGGGEERLHFTLALDDDASVEVLRPGAEVAFGAGYVTDGGLEAPAGRILWVSAVRRDGGLLHVEAEGALGVLARWRASRQITWAAGERPIAGIAAGIARLAGYGVASDGSSEAASTWEPAFTIRAGDHAAAALRRLFTRTPDLVFARGLQVVMIAGDPEDEPVATFALDPYGDEHAVLAAGLTEERERVGWARAIGDGAAAQAVDLDAIERGGGVAIAVDETLDAASEVGDRAATEMRRAALALERAWAEVVPHPGIEPADVVRIDAPSVGLDGVVLRVQSVRLDYAARPRGRYVMRLRLGAL